MTWKIGVKIQANRLRGSVGLAGSRGGCGDADGIAPEPDDPAPGAQATITTATTIRSRSAGPIRRSVGDRVTGARPR